MATVKKLQIAGKIGGGLPAPENATAGQIIEISAVDENGVITATVCSDRLIALEASVADLLYKPMAITSFTNNVNTAEMGSTVNSVTFRWALNKTPTGLDFDGTQVALDSTSTTVERSITATETWTLEATDDRGAIATKTTTINFWNGVYYGAGLDPLEEGLVELTKVLSSTRKRTFTVNAVANEYIWYALPVRLGQCTFKVGGFEGGFDLVATEDFTNPSGYTEQYYIYRSANAGLGSTTVEVS